MHAREPSRDPQVVKKMADLLKLGAAMLAERCPLCGLPLFRLRSGEVVCPVHGRVFIVRNESELLSVRTLATLEELEKVVVSKIESIIAAMRQEHGGGDDVKAASALLAWLTVLEKAVKLMETLRPTRQQESKSEASKAEERRS